ncbi:hypothetical protein B6I21_09645 [candidate division KSB1 bacterium 4572_119]|nr:MAG: hypothetical protein B6I21_09645 [candidate division KSB1 bacterium 4572_119]
MARLRRRASNFKKPCANLMADLLETNNEFKNIPIKKELMLELDRLRLENKLNLQIRKLIDERLLQLNKKNEEDEQEFTNLK